MPVYKSIELVATLAAPPSHDQGLRQTWQQHIPATRSMCQYWNNLKKQPRESRSPTITQVEIPSGPPLSYLQSNEHTCQIIAQEPEPTSNQFQQIPCMMSFWTRPNTYDQLLSVTTEVSHVTPKSVLGRGQMPTVEQDTINRCKQVENHMCIAPARICRLSSFNKQNLALLASGMGNTLPGPTRQCHRCRLPVDTG